MECNGATLDRARTGQRFAPRTVLDLPGVTTDQRAVHAAREPAARDLLWIADVSQVWAANAWLYFAFVLDRHSRRCLGFSSHRVLHAGLVARAVQAAVVTRRSYPELDLGPRIRRDPALVFTRRCHAAGVDFPRWAVPAATDVAVAASFLTALRRDLLDDEDEDTWGAQSEAASAIRAWIEGAYNPTLPRSATHSFAPGERQRAGV